MGWKEMNVIEKRKDIDARPETGSCKPANALPSFLFSPSLLLSFNTFNTCNTINCTSDTCPCCALCVCVAID
jgi:hypothetical protein